VKKQQDRPWLITDAARSQHEQLRSREIRYVTMMGLRLSCLIAGAVVISIRPPLLPLWLTLCAVGMVVLPWMAVIIANDRLPLSKAERGKLRRTGRTPAPLEQQSAEERDRRTIDGDL
jgi:Protein of unknown function (DUF3099)